MAAKVEPVKCRWDVNKEREGKYEVECGGFSAFAEGVWKDAEFKFCPYCGKEIEEVRDGKN